MQSFRDSWQRFGWRDQSRDDDPTTAGTSMSGGSLHMSSHDRPLDLGGFNVAALRALDSSSSVKGLSP